MSGAKSPRQKGGRAPKAKGSRFERALVRLLQDAGFGAERVPLSGSAGGSYLGDLTIPLLGRDLTAEAKSRAHGFRQLYDWLQSRDLLILRSDRNESLVVIPLRLAIEIAAAAERNKHLNPLIPGAFAPRISAPARWAQINETHGVIENE